MALAIFCPDIDPDLSSTKAILTGGIVGQSETRIECDGFFQLRDGALASTRHGENPAEHVMAEAVLVVQGNGPLARLECSCPL